MLPPMATGRSCSCCAVLFPFAYEDPSDSPYSQAKRELGTLFGNNAENTAVGITGDCEFVCLDGPSVVVRLTGRFWHEKSSVRDEQHES